MTGLGLGDANGEGRYMQADFKNISVASLLAPVASMDDPGSLARKSALFEQLRIQLDKVRKKRRQYILCGNWNMAHATRDVQQAGRHAGTPGFLDAERKWLDSPLRRTRLYRRIPPREPGRRRVTVVAARA